MDVMLAKSEESLNSVFENIESFHASTGFTLSYDKTSLYRVGSMKRSKAKIYTTSEVNWADRINVLGIQIEPTEQETTHINYESVILKTEAVLKSWENRNVSLLGKVNIVNTLVGSLYVYNVTIRQNHERIRILNPASLTHV